MNILSYCGVIVLWYITQSFKKTLFSEGSDKSFYPQYLCVKFLKPQVLKNFYKCTYAYYMC